MISHLCTFIIMTSSDGNILRVTGPLAGNSPVTPATCEFPSQRPVMRSFDVFYDLRVNRLSKQSRRRWFETASRSLWLHFNFQPYENNLAFTG